MSLKCRTLLFQAAGKPRGGFVGLRVNWKVEIEVDLVGWQGHGVWLVEEVDVEDPLEEHAPKGENDD